MSNYAPIRCVNCGSPIANIYMVYRLLRGRIIQNDKVHIDNEYFDSSRQETARELMDHFHLNNCCRLQFQTIITPDDLKHGNR